MFARGATCGQLAKLPEAAGRQAQTIRVHAEKHKWTRDLGSDIRQRASQRAAVERELEKINRNGGHADISGAVASLEESSGEIRSKAGRNVPVIKMLDAMVNQATTVTKRQQDRLDALHSLLERAVEAIEKFLDPDTDEPTRDEIKQRWFGDTTPTMDVLTKIINANKLLLGDERLGFNLDAKPDEKPKVFLPKAIGRNDIVKAAKDKGGVIEAPQLNPEAKPPTQ